MVDVLMKANAGTSKAHILENRKAMLGQAGLLYAGIGAGQNKVDPDP